MSNTVRDLRCTATDALPPEAHYECNVLYKLSDGPPPCPECGAARVPFYATRAMEGAAVNNHAVAGFGTIRMEGETLTREQAEQRIQQYCRTQGVDRSQVDLVVDNEKTRRVRHDEMRHEAWATRKKDGFDTQTYNRYVAEQRERR